MFQSCYLFMKHLVPVPFSVAQSQAWETSDDGKFQGWKSLGAHHLAEPAVVLQRVASALEAHNHTQSCSKFRKLWVLTEYFWVTFKNMKYNLNLQPKHYYSKTDFVESSDMTDCHLFVCSPFLSCPYALLWVVNNYRFILLCVESNLKITRSINIFWPKLPLNQNDFGIWPSMVWTQS